MQDPELHWEWTATEDDPWADGHVLVVQHLRELPDPTPPEGGISDWLDGLQWLLRSSLSAADTAVGRAVLASDLERRRAVTCAAVIQRHKAEAERANPFIWFALGRLAHAVRQTEGFTFGARHAADVIGSLMDRPASCDVVRVVEGVLDQVEDLRDPGLASTLSMLVRSPTAVQLGCGALAERVWDCLDRPLRVIPACSWSRRLLGDYDAADAEGKEWLRGFVDHTSSVGRTPSARWNAKARDFLASSPEPYAEQFSRWFADLAPLEKGGGNSYRNARMARGFVWAAALTDDPPVDALERAAFACHVRMGYEKAGNDAIRVLAGAGAMSSLGRLRVRIRNPQTKAFIDRLLASKP